MHGLVAAGDELVPPVEVAALGNQAVGAGAWQPVDGAHVLWRQPDAIGHARQPVGIVRAATGRAVEQATADARPVDLAGILVLELRQAALAAAVAKRFPLRGAHRLKRRRLPERLFHDAACGARRARRQARRQRSTIAKRRSHDIAILPSGKSREAMRVPRGTIDGSACLGGDGTLHLRRLPKMKRQPRILAGTAIGLFMASAPLGAMPLPDALSPVGSMPPLVRVQAECQEGESAEACAARQSGQQQEQPRRKNKRQQAEQPARRSSLPPSRRPNSRAARTSARRRRKLPRRSSRPPSRRPSSRAARTSVRRQRKLPRRNSRPPSRRPNSPSRKNKRQAAGGSCPAGTAAPPSRRPSSRAARTSARQRKIAAGSRPPSRRRSRAQDKRRRGRSATAQQAEQPQPQEQAPGDRGSCPAGTAGRRAAGRTPEPQEQAPGDRGSCPAGTAGRRAAGRAAAPQEQGQGARPGSVARGAAGSDT